MTAHAALLAVACAALAVALIACGLAVYVYVITRRAVSLSHTHRRLRPEPVHDERHRDTGPPAGQPERRHAHPDGTRARRRDLDDPQWQTRPQAPVEPLPGYPPRPAPRHRHPDEPETVEHPAAVDGPATVEHAPPTAEARALPPPGSIHR